MVRVFGATLLLPWDAVPKLGFASADEKINRGPQQPVYFIAGAVVFLAFVVYLSVFRRTGTCI